jgi:hypothetical protein
LLVLETLVKDEGAESGMGDQCSAGFWEIEVREEWQFVLRVVVVRLLLYRPWISEAAQDGKAYVSKLCKGLKAE